MSALLYCMVSVILCMDPPEVVITGDVCQREPRPPMMGTSPRTGGSSENSPLDSAKQLEAQLHWRNINGSCQTRQAPVTFLWIPLTTKNDGISPKITR